MKLTSMFVAIAAMAICASALYAQRPERERREGDRPRPEGREGREGGPAPRSAAARRRPRRRPSAFCSADYRGLGRRQGTA